MSKTIERRRSEARSALAERVESSARTARKVGEYKKSARRRERALRQWGWVTA